VERVLTVEFGPSRSKRFPKAVEEAQNGAGACSEIEPGRYRVRFVLGADARAYTSLARLLQRARTWRATEVYEGDRYVSSYHAREMAWCASSQLAWFGECRFRYGTHEDVFAAYDDWTDEELQAVLRFQEFSRAWLEEHLETVEELRRQQQPRPNAVRAGRRPKND
jgi:hypothetical protein